MMQQDIRCVNGYTIILNGMLSLCILRKSLMNSSTENPLSRSFMHEFINSLCMNSCAKTLNIIIGASMTRSIHEPIGVLTALNVVFRRVRRCIFQNTHYMRKKIKVRCKQSCVFRSLERSFVPPSSRYFQCNHIG